MYNTFYLLMQMHSKYNVNAIFHIYDECDGKYVDNYVCKLLYICHNGHITLGINKIY